MITSLKIEVYVRVFKQLTNHALSYLTGATLQDDDIADFQFQRPGPTY